MKQCLLLGSVELTVKAIPPRNKAEADISAEVRLDLGHKEYVFIEVKRTSIKGEEVITLCHIMLLLDLLPP